MSRTARCKFTVQTVEPAYPDAPEHSRTVKMQTQYDADLSKEDAAFSTATPSGSMEFQLENPSLTGFFEPGKAYFVDITPAE